MHARLTTCSLCLMMSVWTAGALPSTAESNPAAGRTPAALTTTPSAAEMARLYPADALRRRTTGRAVIRCQVSPQGLLNACEIMSATTPGFAAATLKLAKSMRARPAMLNGQPIEGVMTLPVVWTLAGATPPPSPPSQSRGDCPDATTTQAEDECLSQVLDRANAELARYRAASEAQAKASTQSASPSGPVQPDTSAALSKAEAAWSAYREAECASIFDNWSGGTIRVAKELDCEIELTRLQTHVLWGQWLTFPDSTPPVLPEPFLPTGR